MVGMIEREASARDSLAYLASRLTCCLSFCTCGNICVYVVTAEMGEMLDPASTIDSAILSEILM